MHIYVGVTDRLWFNFHRTRNAEEVNFWRPGESAFRALGNGEKAVNERGLSINRGKLLPG
jgi:hypothetical protein